MTMPNDQSQCFFIRLLSLLGSKGLIRCFFTLFRWQVRLLGYEAMVIAFPPLRSFSLSSSRPLLSSFLASCIRSSVMFFFLPLLFLLRFFSSCFGVFLFICLLLRLYTSSCLCFVYQLYVSPSFVFPCKLPIAFPPPVLMDVTLPWQLPPPASLFSTFVLSTFLLVIGCPGCTGTRAWMPLTPPPPAGASCERRSTDKEERGTERWVSREMRTALEFLVY